MDLTIEGLRPPPFAFDILLAAFQYGNRAFTKYPADIADYMILSSRFPRDFAGKEHSLLKTGACASPRTINIKVRIHGAILRAMAKLQRVSTPKIVARNIARNIAAFPYKPCPKLTPKRFFLALI